jgi:hypothetical protein
VATQLNDMSLGNSGFAAGYTPIRFAPLVSLTGPIQGATPPTPGAAAPQAPMIRPPILPQDQGGGYEVMGRAYEGKPIGDVSRMGSPAGRQAELANLANAAGFFMNPLGMMANYVLTGQSPAQMFGVGDFQAAQGAPQRGLMPEGGLSGIFGGVRDFLFGPPQESVSLAEAQGGPSQQTLGMAAQSATNIANMYGLSPEQAAQVGQTAAGLVAQGMNITEAITLATSAYSARPDMAGSPFGQPAAQGAAPQFAPQGISPAVMAQMVSGAADMFGRPISADAVAVNPIGGGGQIGVSPDFVEQSSAADNYGVMGFSGGGQSPSEFSFDDASSGAYGYF